MNKKCASWQETKEGKPLQIVNGLLLPRQPCGMNIKELLDLADRFLRAVGRQTFGDSARKGDAADG